MRHTRDRLTGPERYASKSNTTDSAKVHLAAVVYHETMPDNQDDSVRAADMQRLDTHDVQLTSSKSTGSGQNCNKKPSDENGKQSKLGRLFSKKKQTTTLAGNSTLIDNVPGQSVHNQASLLARQTPPSQSKFTDQHHSPPTLARTSPMNHQRNWWKSDELHKSAGVQVQTFAHDETDTELLSRLAADEHQQPVIEFKFDLIVDQQDENSQLKPLDQHRGPSKRVTTSMSCRLNDTLNELVESFILNSNDVCLISTGKGKNFKKSNAPAGYHLESGGFELERSGFEFEYLLDKLCAQTLDYSFELIANKCLTSPILSCGATGGNCSIEVSATLFLANAARLNCSFSKFSILDLLLPEGESETDKRDPANNWTFVDCTNIDQALNVLNRVRMRLNSSNYLSEQEAKQPVSEFGLSKLLIVTLKLKRRVNGGLFSNRMCLIDFDTKFYELEPILVSIFNGSALAHLKKRKHHLQSLDDKNLELKSSRGDLVGHPSLEFEKELLRAECMLYKQLSSALMKTLVIVHVRKLSTTSSMSPGEQSHEQQQLRLNLERQIMADNLELLEFARSIQRASSMRLKRRKKHLRSYMASSNVSVASGTLFRTTGCELPQSPHRSKTRHNGIERESARLRAYLEDIAFKVSNRTDQRRLPGSMGAVCSKRFDTTQALFTQARRNRHRYGDIRGHCNLACRRHQELFQLEQVECSSQRHTNHQHHSDMTESSSMSTSSGDQATGATRRADSSTPTLRQQTFCQSDDFQPSSHLLDLMAGESDSDSVTSAFLNSCSSSSAYNNTNLDLSRSSGLMHKITRGNPIAYPRSFISSEDPGSIELSSMSPKRRSSSVSQSTNPRLHESTTCSMVTSQAKFARSHLEAKMKSKLGNELRDNPQLEQNQPIDMDSTGRLALSSRDSGEDIGDNTSDICSVIAEPPKQLKLEEFLKKLNNVIAPISAIQSNVKTDSATLRDTCKLPLASNGSGTKNSSMLDGDKDKVDADMLETASLVAPVGYNVPDLDVISDCVKVHLKGNTVSSLNHLDTTGGNLRVDEEDEDCKSHSSILEHLSSLALESNIKLHQRLAQTIALEDNSMSPDLQNDQITLEQSRSPRGHLQRLLNSSSQLRKANSPRVVTVASSSSSGDNHSSPRAPIRLSHDTRSNSSEVFTSSNDSTCSSSSASSSMDARGRLENSSIRVNQLQDMYAVVMRNQLGRASQIE